MNGGWTEGMGARVEKKLSQNKNIICLMVIVIIKKDILMRKRVKINRQYNKVPRKT